MSSPSNGLPESLTAGPWRCAVCQRDRAYDDIEVATHLHVFPDRRLEVRSNVKFCKDSENCRKMARTHNFEGLAVLRLGAENAILRNQAKHDARMFKWFALVLAILIVWNLVRLFLL